VDKSTTLSYERRVQYSADERTERFGCKRVYTFVCLRTKPLPKLWVWGVDGGLYLFNPAITTKQE
jgi:hypothetical protein